MFALKRVPRLAAVTCRNTVSHALSAVLFRRSRREGEPHFVHATGTVSIVSVDVECEGEARDVLLPGSCFDEDVTCVALASEGHAVGVKGRASEYRHALPGGTFAPIAPEIPSSRGVRAWVGLDVRRLRQIADALGDTGGVFIGVGGPSERVRVLSLDHESMALGVLMPIYHDGYDAAALSRGWDRNRAAVLRNLDAELFIENEPAPGPVRRVGGEPVREGVAEEGAAPPGGSGGCEGSALAKEAAAPLCSTGSASESLASPVATGVSPAGALDLDPLYERACEVMREESRVRVSQLQRVLGVGYTRATSLIDRMVREKLVAPRDESGVWHAAAPTGGGA